MTLTPEEKEHRRIQRSLRITGGFAVSVLAAGTVFYHWVEDLSWLDAIYFCTITLTTIGYGDITPRTDAGKMFTVFYVIMGIGILAAFANLLIKNAVAKRYLRQTEKRQKQ